MKLLLAVPAAAAADRRLQLYAIDQETMQALPQAVQSALVPVQAALVSDLDSCHTFPTSLAYTGDGMEEEEVNTDDMLGLNTPPATPTLMATSNYFSPIPSSPWSDFSPHALFASPADPPGNSTPLQLPLVNLRQSRRVRGLNPSPCGALPKRM